MIGLNGLKLGFYLLDYLGTHSSSVWSSMVEINEKDWQHQQHHNTTSTEAQYEKVGGCSQRAEPGYITLYQGLGCEMSVGKSVLEL